MQELEAEIIFNQYQRKNSLLDQTLFSKIINFSWETLTSSVSYYTGKHV